MLNADHNAEPEHRPTGGFPLNTFDMGYAAIIIVIVAAAVAAAAKTLLQGRRLSDAVVALPAVMLLEV